MGRNVTDMGIEKVEKKRELKKHAATIHCSNALSLLQRKISNALLFHAYKELMQKEEHEITLKQLCHLIGYQGHNHAAIREALKGLISTVIEWNLIDDKTGTENWTASSIIASVSLEGPLCYYAYSPRMKQLLHTPSMFGKIDLVIQSRFRSSYGLALYENCIRYLGLPHTKWFEMELFKKLMGIPDGMYDVFRDFKRRVLDKAVDEVNMYSDLLVAAELVREGRKVVRVRFKLKERAKKTRLGKQANAEATPALPNNMPLREKLINIFMLSDKQVTQVLGRYETAFIEEKMALIQASRPFKQGSVENPTAYLMSALKKDFQKPAPKSKGKQAQAEVVNLAEVKHEQQLLNLKRHVTVVQQQYQQYREEVVQLAIDALTKKERETFLKKFTEFAEPTIASILRLQKSKYTRDNVLDSPHLKALLRQYAVRELDMIVLLPLEEFVAGLEDELMESWFKLKSLDPDHPLLRV